MYMSMSMSMFMRMSMSVSMFMIYFRLQGGIWHTAGHAVLAPPSTGTLNRQSKSPNPKPTSETSAKDGGAAKPYMPGPILQNIKP